MDVYVSTVARWSARSRADAHADRSTFVSRKATISGFATNPTRTFFADALKPDRNHRITLYYQRGMRSSAQFHLMPDKISLYAGRISLYAGQISLYAGSHTPPLCQRRCASRRLLNERSFSIMA